MIITNRGDTEPQIGWITSHYDYIEQCCMFMEPDHEGIDRYRGRFVNDIIIGLRPEYTN